MPQHTLQQLAEKLDNLINYSERLKRDNELLKQQERQWQSERTQLIEKNNLACNRVEAMITHLKSLEENIN